MPFRCPALREAEGKQLPKAVCAATGQGDKRRNHCPISNATDPNCNVIHSLPVLFAQEWREKQARRRIAEANRQG